MPTRLHFLLPRSRPPPPRLAFFAPAFTISPPPAFRWTATSVLNAYRYTTFDSTTSNSRGFLTSARLGGRPQHEPLLPPLWKPRKGAKWKRDTEHAGRTEKVSMMREEKVNHPFPIPKNPAPTSPFASPFAAPAAPPSSSSSSSNGGRPPQLYRSAILSHLIKINSSPFQRSLYDTSVLDNYDQVRARHCAILRLVDKLRGTRHGDDPQFEDSNYWPRFGDANGETVTWYTREQYLIFHRSGLLSVREERELMRVIKSVRRELKKRGISDFDGTGAVGAPAGSEPSGGSPKDGAGEQGGGGVVTGGSGGVDTTSDSGSIYLPWDLSSTQPAQPQPAQPKKLARRSRTFLGREEWQHIEGMVDRGSSRPVQI